MKKHLLILLSFSLLLTLAASCGEKSTEQAPISSTATATEEKTETMSEKEKNNSSETSKAKEKTAQTTSLPEYVEQTETAPTQAPTQKSSAKSKTKPKDNEKIDYSYKGKYAKIRCPEVPYYGFIDPLDTLLYEKYDTAVKRDKKSVLKGDLMYRDYKNGVEIAIAPDSGKIPEKIGGKPVVKLGGRIQFEYDDADSFVESLESDYATTVTIPSGVKEIVFNTFESLKNLEKINVSPDNPYYSSVDGILYNKDKTVLLCIPLNHQGGEINIPKTVKTAYSLFSNNTVEVNIPASVKKLSSALNVRGEYTNSVYNLDELSIDSCLDEINVDKANTAYSSIDGVLYNKKQTKLYVYPCGRDDKIFKIPDSVRVIDNIYLDFYDNLKEIDFGKNIKKIGFCSEPAMAGYDRKLTVKGYKNTAAKKWAKDLNNWDNNVKFIALD